ncbi:hypothetical protein ACTXT7_016205, partial [Hymenolepis weldensis]
LSDWFLDQMLVVRSAGGDGLLSEGSPFPSEAEIKRSYKRRNAELKQRLNELETRLTDTRLAISQLEENARQAAEERSKAKGTPSAANESRTPTGQSAMSNEDTVRRSQFRLAIPLTGCAPMGFEPENSVVADLHSYQRATDEQQY